METDFLIIGSGIAGLSFALKAALYGDVVIVTKDAIKESNTLYAQGGLAGVFSEDDSFDEHIKNTLRAGDCLCNKKAVEVLVENAPKEILWLEKLGVKFDKNGKFKLSREAVHTKSRIVHAGDITGEEVEDILVKRVNENKRIKVLEYNLAVSLIVRDNVCLGVGVLDIKNNNSFEIFSKATILATGGLGQIYEHTCNPSIATGDGFALAYDAGASLQDMEFVQFHPTGLFGTNFLISETLRGEGGHLRNKDGEIYMPKYHRDGELAPRDVVSKFTVDEMKRTKADHVFLDVTHLDSGYLKKRFPKIYKRCLKEGIDITKGGIPVTPTAHYSCGGVKTDLKGATDVIGLYAIGEVSCSGLHGADRLASNSLTDGLVFGSRLVDYLKKTIGKNQNQISNKKLKINIIRNKEVDLLKNKLKHLMWDKVGIIRNEDDLSSALKEFYKIEERVRDFIKDGINKELIELRNIVIVAKLVSECALKRKESRGTHFFLEYPNKDEGWKKHSIIKK